MAGQSVKQRKEQEGGVWRVNISCNQEKRATFSIFFRDVETFAFFSPNNCLSNPIWKLSYFQCRSINFDPSRCAAGLDCSGIFAISILPDQLLLFPPFGLQRILTFLTALPGDPLSVILTHSTLTRRFLFLIPHQPLTVLSQKNIQWRVAPLNGLMQMQMRKIFVPHRAEGVLRWNRINDMLYNIIMKNLILLVALLAVISCLPDEDQVMPPGMINETVYSGYLDTGVPGRKIHYVFVAARENAKNAPLTIWFNGGPGCSSLIGMLQEIGPYLVGNEYQKGDILKRNEYSWNKISNLLFLESPATVGFSTDKDPRYPWTDRETGDNAFQAIKNFLKVKAPEFHMRDLYLSGQSYAGKYVPDVAVRILAHNQDSQVDDYINLKGIFLGNGVMNFRDNSLDKSEIEYMYEHDFVNQRLWSIYRHSCLKDFNSPRCRYVQMELDEYDEDAINPYNVYEVCQDASVEALRMKEAVRKLNKAVYTSRQAKKSDNFKMEPEKGVNLNLGAIDECPNDNGAIKYWNSNTHAYHVDNSGKTWEPCTDVNYTIGLDGSMEEYRRIFLNRAVKVWLFNGDWDDVVPYRDTEKSLEALKIAKVKEWEPWFVETHHAGFYQEYDKLYLITVKAASHMVPQAKPIPAYQLFYNFIKNRPINTPV